LPVPVSGNWPQELTTRMINFPFCKINLGLNVISKRADGFHNIETCLYPVPWKDVLEIIPSNEQQFSVTGIEVPGDPQNNIVLKAYNLLKKDFELGNFQIHLHKIIPHGAGLGGGSSDGAHALKLINQIFNLNLPQDVLRSYALQLGSDCPFFIDRKPMIATGRGEVLQSFTLDLTSLHLLIVKPPVEVSTAEAYSNIFPAMPKHDLRTVLSQPVNQWKLSLKNDFEETVFKRYPLISEIKEELYNLGAVYSSMSGSGSAVYGLFNSRVEVVDHFEGMQVWQWRL